MSDAKPTALIDLHREAGARLVDFAGWNLPIQYQGGIIQEHHNCRQNAALFDVSHMLQLSVTGANAAETLEQQVPSSLTGLKPLHSRYTVLLNPQGGVIDDLIVTRTENGIGIVSNASRREFVLEAMQNLFGSSVEEVTSRSLLALQGPRSAAVMAALSPDAASLSFMQRADVTIDGAECQVSRTGYTGEDGFEISVPHEAAVALARKLLSFEGVELAGLGARDSLRLEAGLCLYGQELDETTTPAEAKLSWLITKSRIPSQPFAGMDVIQEQLQNRPAKLLSGLIIDGRAPARQGAEIFDPDGGKAGIVTSGGFSPTLEKPICLGYVRTDIAKPGQSVTIQVRNRQLSATITKLPFVPHRYHRG